MVLFGCDRDKNKYGTKFDVERAKRSIPLLGTNAATMSDWGTAWVYDFVEKGRCAKAAQTKSGEILWEYDTYYSGRKYTGADGSAQNEYLQITYSFEAEKRGSNPWSALYVGSNGQEAVSFEVAEKLLRSWGLQRIEGKP